MGGIVSLNHWIIESSEEGCAAQPYHGRLARVLGMANQNFGNLGQ